MSSSRRLAPVQRRIEELLLLARLSPPALPPATAAAPRKLATAPEEDRLTPSQHGHPAGEQLFPYREGHLDEAGSSGLFSATQARRRSRNSASAGESAKSITPR